MSNKIAEKYWEMLMFLSDERCLCVSDKAMLWKCLTWILLLLILTIKGSKIIFNKAIFIIESHCVIIIIIMDWEHMVSLFVYFRFKERVYMELIMHDLLHDLCSHKQGHTSGWIMVLFNVMTLAERVAKAKDF